MNRNAVGRVTINSVQEDRSCESSACTKMQPAYGLVVRRSLVP
jgi:hypothetical protein